MSLSYLRGGILPREASQFRTGTIESERNQYDRPRHLRAFDVGSRMAICGSNFQHILIMSVLGSRTLNFSYFSIPLSSTGDKLYFNRKQINAEGRPHYYRSKKNHFHILEHDQTGTFGREEHNNRYNVMDIFFPPRGGACFGMSSKPFSISL